jgi:hypothetical protein
MRSGANLLRAFEGDTQRDELQWLDGAKVSADRRQEDGS